MEYLFYVSEDGLKEDGRVCLTGQEAQHISRVLRHGLGDEILVGDGQGRHYRCRISDISKKEVWTDVLDTKEIPQPSQKIILAFGAIKKRDRLEFAAEKAVELGVWKLCLFDADHSERSRINKERLQAVMLSAFKQSKRFWLPGLSVEASLDEVLDKHPNHIILMAHQHVNAVKQLTISETKDLLLLVGPEGGFSRREAELATESGGHIYSLGSNRLRAETAVVAFLAQFID